MLGYAIERKGSADFLFLFWVDYSFGLSQKNKIKFGIPERVSKEVSSRRGAAAVWCVCRIEK